MLTTAKRIQYVDYLAFFKCITLMQMFLNCIVNCVCLKCCSIGGNQDARVLTDIWIGPIITHHFIQLGTAVFMQNCLLEERRKKQSTNYSDHGPVLTLCPLHNNVATYFLCDMQSVRSLHVYNIWA